MKQVTKKQFYAYVGPRDICVTSMDLDHSRFETRGGLEVGRVYDTDKRDSNARTIYKYYLTDEALSCLAVEKEA